MKKPPPRNIPRRSGRIRANKHETPIVITKDQQLTSQFSSISSDSTILILEFIDSCGVCVLRRLSTIFDNLCWQSLQRPRELVFPNGLSVIRQQKLIELCPKAIGFRAQYSKLEKYQIQSGYAVKATDARLSIRKNRPWFPGTNEHLRSISLYLFQKVATNGLSIFSNLREIKLCLYFALDGDIQSNFDFLKHCHRLESFTVAADTTATAAFAVLKTLPTSLVTLRFEGPRMDDYLERISQQFPHLQVLEIDYTPTMQRSRRVLLTFPNLTSFSTLSESLVSSSSSPHSFPNMKSLNLYPDSYEGTNEAIRKCENLQQLQLSEGDDRRISNLPEVFRLSRLSELTISYFSFDDSCIAPFSQLSSLKTLRLEKCIIPRSWSWFDFGSSLAQTPLDRLELIEGYAPPTVSRYELEDLLKTVQLQFLWVSSMERHATFARWHPDPNNPKVFITGLASALSLVV